MRALLVVDMLVDFIDPGGALYIGPVAESLVAGVKARLDSYRASGDLIIFICDHHLEDDHEFQMFPAHGIEGSGGEEIFPELSPHSSERIIAKRRFSAFFGTDLDLTLREKSVNEIEITGCVTNICILYTSADARALNYKVTVPQNAVASFDQDAHNFALQEMEKTLGVILK